MAALSDMGLRGEGADRCAHCGLEGGRSCWCGRYPLRLRKGDDVVVVLRVAGVETREEATILRVSKGVAYVDNGPGNDPDPYDANSGAYVRDVFFGVFRRVERV